jgi:hypothetical protein
MNKEYDKNLTLDNRRIGENRDESKGGIFKKSIFVKGIMI